LEATRAAVEYKDTLNDLNDRMNAMDPGKQWSQAAAGLGSAFSIASAGVGIMQALGVESEDAAKTIQKMMVLQQAASAMQSLDDMKGAYEAISSVIKTSVIPQIAAMSAAQMGVVGLVTAAVVAIGAMAYSYIQSVDAAEKLLQKEKEIADERKKDLEAFNAAKNNQFKTDELQIRAMADGYAKEHATLMLNKKKELNAEREAWEASNKTYIDKINAENRVAAIKEFYIKQEAELRKKYSAPYTTAIQQVTPKITLDKTSDLMMRRAAIEMRERLRAEMANVPVTPHIEMPKEQSSVQRFWQDFREQMAQEAAKTDEFVKSLTTGLTNALGGAFQQMGQALGESLANSMDESGAERMKKILGSMLANIANTYGAALIALGTPMLFTPAFAKGALYVGAGTALIAAGGYISATMGGGSGGSSAPSTSVAGSGMSRGGSDWAGTGKTGIGGATSNSMNMQLISTISGRDIQLSSGREHYFSKRVAG
jgi:hypothetical protein